MHSERGGRWTSLRLAAILGASAALLAPPGRVGAQAPDTAAHDATHKMSWGRETFVLTEVLEYDAEGAGRPVLFDVVGWSGGAIHRLWFKADGSAATTARATQGDYQLLYGRMVSAWWDVQVGARVDVRSAAGASASRSGAVLGLQGLAPGWFELEPSLFVATDGNVAFDLTASYDLFLTQRLVLQPRLESSVALKDDATFGIGRGLGSTSLGLRTRFEIKREFAPYVGVVWERAYGRSAEMARLAGEPAGETMLVAGLRLWR